MSPADLGSAARIEEVFRRLRDEDRVGLMTHIVLGYPSVEESYRIVDRMVRGGVDLIEVQIPFSDPTADGPLITAACQHALDGGVRVADAFRFLEEVTRRYDVPFLFMSYFNILFSYRTAPGAETAGSGEPEEERGVRGFVGRAAKAGASGLIVPDLPPEQGEGYPEACREFGVHPVYVISPNIGDGRLEAIRDAASGFIYATSRTGTTGKEMEIAMERLRGFLGRARSICQLPLAVGFSISKREHVDALRGHADMAVIGTHLIRTYESAGLDGVEAAVRQLRGR